MLDACPVGEQNLGPWPRVHILEPREDPTLWGDLRFPRACMRRERGCAHLLPLSEVFQVQPGRWREPQCVKPSLRREPKGAQEPNRGSRPGVLSVSPGGGFLGVVLTLSPPAPWSPCCGQGAGAFREGASIGPLFLELTGWRVGPTEWGGGGHCLAQGSWCLLSAHLDMSSRVLCPSAPLM